MNKFLKNWFYDKRILIMYIITFIFLVTGITYALQTTSFAFNTDTAIINIDEAAYGTNTTLDTSNLDMKPIQDSNVTTSSDNVIKIDFGVKGASSNTTPVSGKYIYDVALTGLEVNCNLLSEYVKWKLIKNGEEISSGSLSPKYDHIEYIEDGDNPGGRLVLTDIQQDLKSNSEEADQYTFYMWVSDSCQGCNDPASAVDQTYLFGKKLKGNIEIETYNSLEEAKERTKDTSTSIDKDVCDNTSIDNDVVKNDLMVLFEYNKNDTEVLTWNDSLTTDERYRKSYTANKTYGTLPSATKKITITYNSNGGSSIDDNTSDLTLAGWYKDNEVFNNRVDVNSTVINKLHYLYAKWNAYTIPLPTPTKAGYTFEGWYSDADLTNEVTSGYTTTESMTLYAKWISSIYNISLNNNNADSGGTSLIYAKYNDGIYLNNSNGNLSNKMNNSQNPITIPTKTGYTFDGYYSSESDSESLQLINEDGYITSDFTNTKYTSDATLYAKWVPINYEVTYNSNNLLYGLNDVSDVTSSRMTYSISNGVVTVTANYDDGYGYTTGRVYLEAGKEYIFNCNTNGVWSTTRENSDEVEAYLMLEGLAGNGYYHMRSNENFTFTPSTNGIYWLRLDVNTAGETYTFSNISISTNIAINSIPYNTNYILPNDPVLNGYEFIGWYTDKIGGEKISSSSVLTTPNDHTLYARWEDDLGPDISSVNPSTTLDITNYVDFTAFDPNGIAGYNITTSATEPTTWIPIISAVENTTETKYDKSAAWARVFHHNVHWGTVLYSNSTEAKSSNTSDKYSVLGNLENYRNTSGNFEFLLEYPDYSSTQYNRWLQSENPTDSTLANNSGDGTANAIGYTAIHIDWTSNYWGGLTYYSDSSSTYINGSVGYGWWYYAIGAYSTWKSSIPGSDKYVSNVNLWARIDDKNSINPTNITRRLGDLKSNTTYYVWTKDLLGNTSYKTVTTSYVDTTAPTATITSTNNVETSQTVTLNIGDNKGAIKYYWGTTNPEDNKVSWTDITSTTSTTVSKTVSDSGTYYLAVQDTAGNRTITSKVFYKTTLTMANGTVSPTSVITMSGNSFALPTPTASTGYTNVGSWYTNSSYTSGAKTYGSSYSPTASATLYSKANAKTVTVTFHRNTSSTDTTTATQTFTYGVSGQSFSAKGWSKTAYTQGKWAESSSGTGVYSITSGVADGWINSKSPSIDLYATWTRTSGFTSCGSVGSITTYMGKSWYTISNSNNVCELALNATVGESTGNAYSSSTGTGTGSVYDYIKDYSNVSGTSIAAEYSAGLVTTIDSASGTTASTSSTTALSGVYWIDSGKFYNSSPPQIYKFENSILYYDDDGVSQNTSTSGVPVLGPMSTSTHRKSGNWVTGPSPSYVIAANEQSGVSTTAKSYTYTNSGFTENTSLTGLKGSFFFTSMHPTADSAPSTYMYFGSSKFQSGTSPYSSTSGNFTWNNVSRVGGMNLNVKSITISKTCGPNSVTYTISAYSTTRYKVTEPDGGTNYPYYECTTSQPCRMFDFVGNVSRGNSETGAGASETFNFQNDYCNTYKNYSGTNTVVVYIKYRPHIKVKY